MEMLFYGLAFGFVAGAVATITFKDIQFARLRGQRDGANARANREVLRTMEMHRRAQQAEGELQRIGRIIKRIAP